MGAIRGAALGLQIHLGREPRRPLDVHWVEIEDRPFHKPARGFWTSSVIPDGGIPYLDYCTRVLELDGVAGRRAWQLDPSPEARVYQINDVDDLDHAFSTYTDERGVFCATKVRAAGFDAVNVTDDAIRLSLGTERSLLWWNCESTIWFRWAFVAYATPFLTPAARRTVTVDGLSPEAPGVRPSTVVYDPYWPLNVDPARVARWLRGPSLMEVLTGARVNRVFNAREHLADLLAEMLTEWDIELPVDASAIRTLSLRDQVAVLDAINRDHAPATLSWQRDGRGNVVASSW